MPMTVYADGGNLEQTAAFTDSEQSRQSTDDELTIYINPPGFDEKWEEMQRKYDQAKMEAQELFNEAEDFLPSSADGFLPSSGDENGGILKGASMFLRVARRSPFMIYAIIVIGLTLLNFLIGVIVYKRQRRKIRRELREIKRKAEAV